MPTIPATGASCWVERGSASPMCRIRSWRSSAPPTRRGRPAQPRALCQRVLSSASCRPPGGGLLCAKSVLCESVLRQSVLCESLLSRAPGRGGCCVVLGRLRRCQSDVFCESVLCERRSQSGGRSWMQATGRRGARLDPPTPPRELPAEASSRRPDRHPRHRVRRAATSPACCPASHQPRTAVTSPTKTTTSYLDPAAGHGTFIAGVIEQITPGCQLEVFEVLGTVRRRGRRAHRCRRSLDLSIRPRTSARTSSTSRSAAIRRSAWMLSPTRSPRSTRAGTVVVASAGNDATCVAAVPGGSSRGRGGGCARCGRQPGRRSRTTARGCGRAPLGWTS